MKKFTALMVLLGSLCSWAIEPELRAYYPFAPLVEHDGYALAFNVAKQVPAFVIYRIHPAADGKGCKREGMTFHADPSVSDSPKPYEYAGSGYDLGHMCPADDKDFNVAEMEETFLTSNCAPQLPSLNRGDWRELEAQLHKETLERGPPYFIVICGTIFDKDATKTIGHGVGVPSAFWKVCYDEKAKTIRAWFFPHEIENKKAIDYLVDIKELESKTGLKFKGFDNGKN